MKPKLLPSLALVFAGLLSWCSQSAGAQAGVADAASPNNAEQSFDSLANAYFPGECFSGIMHTAPFVEKLRRLPQDDFNRFAVAAARELSLRTTNGFVITAEAVDELIYMSPAAGAPNDSALRSLIERDKEVTGFLQQLKNIRPITDAGAIGPLIDMLDFPGVKTSVRPEARYVLRSITGRGSDVSQWWKDWWAKNKNKHPVLDQELRKTTADRLNAIRNQILLEVNGCGGLACGLPRANPNTDPINDDLMSVELDSHLASIGPRAQDQIYLLILAHFETPGSDSDTMARRRNPQGLAAGWQAMGSSKITEVHREELPGTDIAITVAAASGDGGFEKQVSACLQKPPESMRTEIARLTEQLKSERDSGGAARTLIEVGEYPPVIAALSNPILAIQRSAIIALADIGIMEADEAKAAGPLLVHLLQTSDSYTRYLAASALGHVHEEDETTAAALLAAMNDENAQVRTSAIISLREYKSQARAIVPVLEKFAHDTNSSISTEASRLLKEFNPDVRIDNQP